MKQTLLLISFIIFCNYSVFTQLHIAKDNINCLYGLKNKRNKWVLAPTYSYIDEVYHNNSIFEVFDGQFRGIISADDGKVIIPCCQDRFDVSFHYYLGYRNDKIMVYNRNGKPLTQQIYDQITPYAYSKDYLWCYKNFPDSLLTSLMQVDVGFLFHDVNGYIKEWEDSIYTIIQDNRDISYMNLGVIDSVGKIILPKIFDNIEIYKNYFVAKKDNYTMFLNAKNELISGPFGRIERFHTTSHNYYFIVYKNDTTCALIDDQLNEVISNGNYSSINFIGFGENSFHVVKNNKHGIIDSVGNVITPFIYDGLTTLGDSYNHSLKFIFKIGNKYGVLNKDGNIELNADYNLFELKTDYRYSLYFLIKDKEVYYLDYNAHFEKLTYLFENKYGIFYQGINHSIFLKMHLNTGIDIIEAGQVSPNYRFECFGNLFTLYNKKYTMNKVQAYDLYGNEIFPNKLKAFYKNDIYLPNIDATKLNSPKYFSTIYAHTKTNKVGLFSSKSGKMLIDTLYSSILPCYPYLNIENIDFMCRKYKLNQYDIYDTLGIKINSIDCDTLYQVNSYNYLRAGLKGKMGIVNSSYNWVIKPKYLFIEPLTENYFLVINQNKKVGVIDINDKLIIDTAYTDFLPVFNNYRTDFFTVNDTVNGFTADKKESWWLFKNIDERVLVNNKGQAIKSSIRTDNNSKIIDSLLLQFAFNAEYISCDDGNCDYSFIKADGTHNISDWACKIFLTRDDKVFLLKQPYVKQLFNILDKAYSDQIKIIKNYYNLSQGFTTDAHKILSRVLHKQINNFGYNFVSIQTNALILEKDSTDYRTDYFNYNYENYIFVNGKLNLINFSEVFKNDEFFRTEVIEAIKKDEDLKLDCTDMNNLYQKINGRFSFTKEGVNLFVEDESYDIRSILIPKKRLKSNKEFKWLIPYLR